MADKKTPQTQEYKLPITPTENTVLGKRELSWYELSDAQKAKLTPRQIKKLGGDMDVFKQGGSVSARADGIAQRGKTRGKMI